jgi:hypothetical protein
MRKRLLFTVAMLAALAMLAGLIAGCGSSSPPASDKPVVSGVTPDTGPAGTQFVIVGQNFGAAQGNGVVHVGIQVAKVSSWSDGSITAVVPTGLDPTTQPVTVLTPAGQSEYIEFTVVKKASDQPDPKEKQAETISAQQAMVNWLKQNGLDPTGWNYTVVNISEKDPNWKIDKASKAGQADKYFLFHRDAKGNWLIVSTGAAPTKAALPSSSAPSDVWTLPPTPKPTPPKSSPQPKPTPQPVSQLDAVKAYVAKQGGSTSAVNLTVGRYSTINPAWCEGTVFVNYGGTAQDVFLKKVGANWTVAFMGPNPSYAQLVALGVPKDLAHTNTEAQAIATWIQNGHAPGGVTPTGWSLKIVRSSKSNPDWEIVSGTQAGYSGTMYWLLQWDGSQWVVMDDGGALNPTELKAPGMPPDLF